MRVPTHVAATLQKTRQRKSLTVMRIITAWMETAHTQSLKTCKNTRYSIVWLIARRALIQRDERVFLYILVAGNYRENRKALRWEIMSQQWTFWRTAGLSSQDNWSCCKNPNLILYVSDSPSSQPLTSQLILNLRFRRIIVHRKPQDDREDVMQQKQQGAIGAICWIRFGRIINGLTAMTGSFGLTPTFWSGTILGCCKPFAILTRISCPNPPVLHTDFSGFRPSALNTTKLFEHGVNAYNAEVHYSNTVKEHIEQHQALRIPGTKTYYRFCRVMGPESPVIHVHDANTAGVQRPAFSTFMGRSWWMPRDCPRTSWGKYRQRDCRKITLYNNKLSYCRVSIGKCIHYLLTE